MQIIRRFPYVDFLKNLKNLSMGPFWPEIPRTRFFSKNRALSLFLRYMKPLTPCKKFYHQFWRKAPDELKTDKGMHGQSVFPWTLTLWSNKKAAEERVVAQKDLLLIRKTVLRDCKRRHTNSAMAWIDKKAYNFAIHSGRVAQWLATYAPKVPGSSQLCAELTFLQ